MKKLIPASACAGLSLSLTLLAQAIASKPELANKVIADKSMAAVTQ